MNVPKLRFKEFDGEWEENKLSNLLVKIEEKATDATKGVVLTSSRTGLFPRSEYFNGREEKDIEGYSIIPKNTFTYRQMSDDNTFHINYNTKYNLGLVSPEYPVFKTNNFLTDEYFLNYINNSPRFKKHCVLQKKGGTRTRLYFKVLGELVIAKPSIEEQKKIGDFFNLLNKKIQLQQQKIDLLQEQKKGYMQKMFPKAGETKPEIRFDGFIEDWVQHKLGDYIIQYNEVTTENNQYPVFTSSRKGLFFQKDYYDGNQIASEDNTGYNIVPRGYFTYRHMSDDLIFKFNINNLADYGIVSTLYPVFTTTEELDSNYLQYQLNEGEEFKRFSILQKQGGSRTYMYLSKLKNLTLTMPNIEEQRKLNNFFMELDKTIALHQKKLDLYREQKMGFMQQMFI